MGEVWKARDTRLNRIVAIKRLKAQHSTRFEQEGRAIAALNHPNICQIYDVGPDYLVLEFVEGKPLRGPLKLEEAVRVAIQIASAVEAAHRRGILHRDLKPGNVLITDSGAKLLDFGLAKMTADSDGNITNTIEGTIAGTAAYMSPEQAQGRPLDERSDLFSFGAVLYEMISGKRAFPGDSLAVVFGSVLRDEPQPVEAPEALAQIVVRCLRKSPTDRFQSMAEVTAALEQCLVKQEDTQTSIAVLPFTNLSVDPENEYFSDGLAEDILNALSQVEGLRVAARTSSFLFKGKTTELVEIAAKLRVSNVLEGSVRRAGNRVRVTTQLVDARNGFQLWSERYDRQMEDIFEVQDEIARAIAERLKVTFARAGGKSTKNVAAYDLYLKGRHFWNLRGPGLKKSIEFFERALEEQADYAPTYAGLADAYSLMAFYGYGRPLEVMPKAKHAAQRALQLNPDLTEAHASLAYVHMMFDWDWAASEREFQRARSLNKAYSPARYWYSIWLFLVGRIEDSIAEARQALEFDPLSAYAQTHVGVMLLFAGRIGEACGEILKALEFNPKFLLGRSILGACYHLLARNGEAIQVLESAVAESERDSWPLAYLGAVWAAIGERDRALEILDELEQRQARQFVSSVHVGAIHANLGDLEGAFRSLQRAYEERDPLTYSMGTHPLIATAEVRRDPRYAELAARVGLKHV
jgi:TolB-like protein/Flp pilus assembly protein TadD